MNQPDRSGGCGSNEWNRYKRVGDAAVMLESFNRAGKSPHDIKISGFGCENGGHGDVCGLSIQTGAADAGAGQEVRDRFHNALGTIVAELAE